MNTIWFVPVKPGWMIESPEGRSGPFRDLASAYEASKSMGAEPELEPEPEPEPECQPTSALG